MAHKNSQIIFILLLSLQADAWWVMRLRRNIEALGVYLWELGISSGTATCLAALGVWFWEWMVRPRNQLISYYSGLSKGFTGLNKECGEIMPLRDVKDMKLIEVDEPLALRDEERFHNGPGVFDLRNQGDGGTTYTYKCVCVCGGCTRTCTHPFFLQKLS